MGGPPRFCQVFVFPVVSPLALRFGHLRLQIRILHAESSQETDSEVWTPDSALRFLVYPFCL